MLGLGTINVFMSNKLLREKLFCSWTPQTVLPALYTASGKDAPYHRKKPLAAVRLSRAFEQLLLRSCSVTAEADP